MGSRSNRAWVVGAGGAVLAALSSYADVAPVDPTPRGVATPRASPTLLAPGTRFETPILEIDGPRAGPTVLLLAGIHGDEPAPPIAARALADGLALAKGRVIVCPEVNRPALAKKTRATPGEARPDLNRNFPTPASLAPTGELAPHVWALIERTQPDLVVDMHEGWDFHRRFPKSVGSSVTYVAGPTETTARPLAEALIAAIDATIDAPDKRFSLLSPGPSGSVARSAAEALGIPSLVLETTRLGQPIELRVAQQELLVRTLLHELDMLGPP